MKITALLLLSVSAILSKDFKAILHGETPLT